MNASSNSEVPEFSLDLLEKLKTVQQELGAGDLNAALDKSLNIAHFVAEVLADPDSKLLVERRGKFRRLLEFS